MNAIRLPALNRSAKMFLVSQALVLGVIIALPWARAKSLPVPLPVPTVQNAPLEIHPLHNEPHVVSDRQLIAVLDKLQPRLRKPRPKISVVDHALRFWGAEATFADKQALSGDEMRRILIDHRYYLAAWGKDAQPLLSRESQGVAVRTQEGGATASHVDHTLATLAEIGTPLDHPVITPTGPATVRDIFTQAIRDFSLNQAEYEWTALALALYAPTADAWVTKEGQHVTFDALAARIMRQGYQQGVCFGNHRLYTLAALLQVDDTHAILQPATRGAIRQHLLEATARLVATQHPQGWWDANWAEGGAVEPGQAWGDLSRRLLATGHALEWWAVAPEDLLPPRETIVRASQWLITEIEKLDEKAVEDNYTFLSHIGRALALWRETTPGKVFLAARAGEVNP